MDTLANSISYPEDQLFTKNENKKLLPQKETIIARMTTAFQTPITQNANQPNQGQLLTIKNWEIDSCIVKTNRINQTTIYKFQKGIHQKTPKKPRRKLTFYHFTQAEKYALE